MKPSFMRPHIIRQSSDFISLFSPFVRCKFITIDFDKGHDDLYVQIHPNFVTYALPIDMSKTLRY